MTAHTSSQAATFAAARQAAEFAAHQSGGSDLLLRIAFVDPDYRVASTAAPAPLAALMRTSSSRAVGLKLALSLFWVAQRLPRRQTEAPAWFWAELIGLPDPKGNGARRIRTGLGAIADVGLIHVESRPPLPSLVNLRHEAGSDGNGQPQPYTLPDPKTTDSSGPRDIYVRVPVELWSNGWLAALRGAALASFVLLLANQDFKDRSKSIFLSRSRLIHYGLSADTWQSGLRELDHYDLIEKNTTRSIEPRYEGLKLASEDVGLYAARTDVALQWHTISQKQPSAQQWHENPENPQRHSKAGKKSL